MVMLIRTSMRIMCNLYQWFQNVCNRTYYIKNQMSLNICFNVSLREQLHRWYHIVPKCIGFINTQNIPKNRSEEQQSNFNIWIEWNIKSMAKHCSSMSWYTEQKCSSIYSVMFAWLDLRWGICTLQRGQFIWSSILYLSGPQETPLFPDDCSEVRCRPTIFREISHP